MEKYTENSTTLVKINSNKNFLSFFYFIDFYIYLNSANEIERFIIYTFKINIKSYAIGEQLKIKKIIFSFSNSPFIKAVRLYFCISFTSVFFLP